MRTKGLTYSDHIVPSVENLISQTQTEAILKKKKKKKKRTEEGVVGLQRRSQNDPSGPHECKSTASWQCLLTSRVQLQRGRVPAGPALPGSSCHFNTEKCTRMTNCRQGAPRYWTAQYFALSFFFFFFFLCKTPSFHYPPGT